MFGINEKSINKIQKLENNEKKISDNFVLIKF